jgi:hypothetical protein
MLKNPDCIEGKAVWSFFMQTAIVLSLANES